MIELRQSGKDLRRDHAFAAFVVSIGPLRDIDLLADFCLRKVRIFSQITDAFIFFSHLHHREHDMKTSVGKVHNIHLAMDCSRCYNRIK